MPLYEYYCPSCRSRFELLRGMGESEATASCPECATEARRALSVFAAPGRSTEAGPAAMPAMGGGGGCCGGACGC